MVPERVGEITCLGIHHEASRRVRGRDFRPNCSLAENWNAQTAVDEHGLANYSPMREIRYHDAGGQRVFYFVQDDQLWVLGASKKQDAEREMEQSYNRMKKVRAWMKEQKKKNPKERR